MIRHPSYYVFPRYEPMLMTCEPLVADCPHMTQMGYCQHQEQSVFMPMAA
jgi:hypothetical protein